MSKPNSTEQVITGTSANGSLQEALDAALAQAGHGAPWRLASIDGVQGFVNEVNVRIFAVAGAAADQPIAPGEPGEVPTTLEGTVERLAEEISFCQDGAEYELVTQTAEGEERLRLRAITGRAGSVLRRAAGTGEQVSVTGFVRTVECTRLDVFQAQRVPADASASDRPGGGEPTTTLQGTVEVLANEISFCQDGAEYELVTQTAEGEQRLRLSAANGRAESVLKRFAGTGLEVSVTGVIVHVECTSMRVESAAPVRAAAGAAEG